MATAKWAAPKTAPKTPAKTTTKNPPKAPSKTVQAVARAVPSQVLPGINAPSIKSPNPNATKANNVADVGMLPPVKSAVKTANPATKNNSTRQAVAEAAQELVRDGILPEDILDDDDLFDFVSKSLAPKYDVQEKRIKEKYKLLDQKDERDISDEIKLIAKNKELYLERYHTVVDRAIDLAAKQTGRTREDLADDLARLGVLGERERYNIRDGMNASGRFKSSETVRKEKQSLEDQAYAEGKTKDQAERDLMDIEDDKKDAIEDADLLKRGQITQWEFEARQKERAKKTGAKVSEIDQANSLDTLARSKAQGITDTIMNIRDTEYQKAGYKEQELVGAERGNAEQAIEDTYRRL